MNRTRKARAAQRAAPPVVRDDDERLSLKAFTEKAYLDYAMYVILDRALPHVGDGLKPVQRRILYAMSELGLASTARFKKSARTVGDVIGKFHPHGDSAAYEAMVLMAQPFSYRYPLIDGQGNWGSSDDPKSFAAMRYTESRLTAYTDLLLRELEMGTVDWRPNFDGTLQEPTLLPARLPNILLNGASGIAVGMAADIPPHNLREVAAACIHLLDHPDAPLEALCAHIRGPDFPTAAEITTAPEELAQIYRSGRGGVQMRARWRREGGDIVIFALPWQVSGAKALEQIAAQMRAKKLPMVEDLRDESDHEQPVRLVVIPRSNRVDVEELMSHLFATTDLERSCRVNLNLIGLDGRPRVKDLRTLLNEWLTFRKQTARRRLEHRLRQVGDRLHRLAGLLIAYLNIDEVIAIIRAEDRPKPALMARFGIDDAQAEAILELKLRRLAKLEEIKIRTEQEALEKERAALQRTLGDARRMDAMIRAEIVADAEKYGDERRSPLVARSAARALAVDKLLPVEPITAILSARGWVRAAKGHDIDAAALPYKGDDHLLAAVHGRSNQSVCFLDSAGRAYAVAAAALPSARGQGEPLTGRLDPPPGAHFVGLWMGDGDERLLIASDAGYGFIARGADLHSKNRAGKAFLTLPKGAQPLPIVSLEAAFNAVEAAQQRSESGAKAGKRGGEGDAAPEALVAVAANVGRLLLFPLAELPELPRGKGNKMIAIPAARVAAGEERLVGVAALAPGQTLRLTAGKRTLTLKRADLERYRAARGLRGAKLPRGFQRVERIEAV